MELKELGTATAVNKAGLEELRRGRAYERSPSPGRVYNESNQGQHHQEDVLNVEGLTITNWSVP